MLEVWEAQLYLTHSCERVVKKPIGHEYVSSVGDTEVDMIYLF